jgi:GTP-binding protein
MENMSANKRPDAVFISSSAFYKELPEPQGEEYAVLGRSNVGKSSFINHVLANSNLARVSKTPGKTSLANLYKLDESMFWVDLPGYGYAKVAGDEKKRWSKLIADYCENRPNLMGLLWLIDIRHIGVKADMEAFPWLSDLGKPLFPVLTKGDKLTTNEKKKQLKAAIETFGFESEPVIYSVNDHMSRERFWDKFTQWRNGL